jgi:hypothetical protein
MNGPRSSFLGSAGNLAKLGVLVGETFYRAEALAKPVAFGTGPLPTPVTIDPDKTCGVRAN